MKEHLFFIETNLQPVAGEYIREANRLKKCFERLLYETLCYANNVVSKDSIDSFEFVTPYTLSAEEKSSRLTGASINTNITKQELSLIGTSNNVSTERLYDVINFLNQKSYYQLQEVIAFQKHLLEKSLSCQIFITLYDEMLKHDTEEAEKYLEILNCLQHFKNINEESSCRNLNFWNHIMKEHAQFVDGLLDPTEEDLKKSADTLVDKFEELVQTCLENSKNHAIEQSRNTTEQIAMFKSMATQGLLECKIKAIIPSLLADHILREANHYLRILTMTQNPE